MRTLEQRYFLWFCQWLTNSTHLPHHRPPWVGKWKDISVPKISDRQLIHFLNKWLTYSLKRQIFSSAGGCGHFLPWCSTTGFPAAAITSQTISADCSLYLIHIHCILNCIILYCKIVHVSYMICLWANTKNVCTHCVLHRIKYLSLHYISYFA